MVHQPALVVGVQQLLGLFAQGAAQILPVQGLDLGVLVGEAHRGALVQGVQPLASLAVELLVLAADGLSSAAHEDHLSRDEEDYELEVGSAGLGQPFKVAQQYHCFVGKEVEVLDADGKKYKGTLKSVDGNDFIVTVQEKQKVEGKKRPQLVELDRQFQMDKVKYTKYLINFK